MIAMIMIIMEIMIPISDTQLIYLFKVNNRDSRKRFGICSKLTIKVPEQRN